MEYLARMFKFQWCGVVRGGGSEGECCIETEDGKEHTETVQGIHLDRFVLVRKLTSINGGNLKFKIQILRSAAPEWEMQGL